MALETMMSDLEETAREHDQEGSSQDREACNHGSREMRYQAHGLSHRLHHPASRGALRRAGPIARNRVLL